MGTWNKLFGKSGKKTSKKTNKKTKSKKETPAKKNKAKKQYEEYNKSEIAKETKKKNKKKQSTNKTLKDAKQAYKKGKDVTYLGTKQTQTKTVIGKNTKQKKTGKGGVSSKEKLTSVNALTKTEFNRMTDASRLNNRKQGNQLLKGNKRTGQKDIREKVGSKTAESAYKSKAATGVMQGMSKADIFSNSVGTYNDKAKKAIKKTKESTAYNIGYGVGVTADALMGGLGSKGASAAELTGKGVAKIAAKAGAKKAAKETAEKAVKETAEKAVKKKAAKTFAKNRAGELVAETPSNLLDAAKMSMDTDGNIDKDEMAKYALANTAMTVGTGGGIEGVGGALTKKQGSKAVKLLQKQKDKTITKEESEELGKIINKLKNKANGTESVSSVYAKDSADSIKASARETKLGNRMKASETKGEQMRADYAASKEASERKAQTAQKKEDFEAALAEDTRAKAEKENLDYERSVQKEGNSALSYREIEAKKSEINKRIQTEEEKVNTKVRSLEEKKDTLRKYESTLKGEYKQSATNELQKIDREIEELKKNGTADLRQAKQDLETVNKETAKRYKAELSRKQYGDLTAEGMPASARSVDTAENQPVSASAKADDTVAPKAEENEAGTKSEPVTDTYAPPKEGETARDVLSNPKGETTEQTIEAEVEAEIKELEDEGIEVTESMEEQITNEVEAEVKAAEAEEAELYKAARVSRDDVTKKSTDDLKKERRSLEFGIKNGKTEEHIELRKQRKAEINAELDRRFGTKRSVQNADELEAAANGEYTKQLENSANETMSAWQAFRRLFVDDKNGFEELANGIKDKGLRQYVRETINSVRNARNLAGGWVTQGRYINGKRTGSSVKEILGDFLKKGHEEEYQLFQDYCFHKHNVARAGQGKEVYGGVTSEQSAEVCKAIEKEHPEFAGKQKEVTDYFRDLQKYRVDAGLISKDAADYLDALYPDYVPTYRVIDGGTLSGYSSADIKAMRAAKGGNQELKQLHEQMINQTEYTIKMGEQNRLLNVVAATQGVDVKGLDPDITVADLVQASSHLSAKTDGASWKYSVTFFDNGEPRTVQLTDQMYKGIADMKNDTSSLTDMFNWKLKGMKTVSKVNQLYKNLITGWNLIFGMKNIVKDTGEALIYSKDTRKFMASYGKAISAVVNKRSKYRAYFDAYQANGGKFAHIRDVLIDFDIEKMIDPKHPLKTMANINDSLEAIPRMAEFIATVEKRGGISNANGKVLREAMYNANEVTLNFGRAGTAGKALNSTFLPYFNPAVQGLDKLVRVFKDAGADGTKGILSLGMKLGAFAMAPTAFNEMINYAYMSATGDRSYLDLNGRDKDSNFLIPMGMLSDDGRGKFIKFPQSRVASAVSAPLGHILRHAMYGDSMDWKQMFKTAWDNVGVMNPYNNNLFSPIYLTMMNKTWYGGSIDSASDLSAAEAGEARNAYDSTTTQLAIWIGDKINKSPKRIDNIIESYTGGIGDILPSVPFLGSQAAEGNPLFKNFILDSAFSNKLATEFWDKYSKLEAKGKLSDEENTKFDSYKNEYGEKVYTLLDAIENVNASDSETKADDVRALKIQLNKVYRCAENGKKCDVEPVSEIAKVLGADKALKSYLPTSKQDKYNRQLWYKDYKDAIGYKDMSKKQKKKAAEDYLTVYTEGVKFNYKVDAKADYNDSPDWDVTGIAALQLAKEGKISKKNAKQIMLSSNVYESSIENYEKYVKNGGTLNTYAATKKRINKMEDNLSGYGMDSDSNIWYNKYYKGVRNGARCLSLATSDITYKDRAYYIETLGDDMAAEKMNAARGFAKYGHSVKELCKLANKADDKGDQNTYLNSDEIINVCNSMNASDEEKSMAYVLLGGAKTKNPFGAIGDYSLKSDTGMSFDDSSSGSGSSGSGRSYGRSGGSGGSSGSGGTTPSGYDEYNFKTVKTKNVLGSASSSTSSDDAYRRKLRQYMKKLR